MCVSLVCIDVSGDALALCKMDCSDIHIIKNELKVGGPRSQHLRTLCPRNSLKHKHTGLTGHQLLLPHLDQNQLLVLSYTHLLIFQEGRKSLCSELYSSIKHVHSSTKQRGFLAVASQLMFSCFDAMGAEYLPHQHHAYDIFFASCQFCFLCLFSPFSST